MISSPEGDRTIPQLRSEPQYVTTDICDLIPAGELSFRLLPVVRVGEISPGNSPIL